MESYIVLYRDEKIMTPLDAPFGFQCWADDTDHAEEQCENAYPGCDIVWVVLEGESAGGYDRALQNYWKVG